jgi:hypothetical protein
MRTKAQIKEFIEINHHLMTVSELAEELGVLPKSVDHVCRSNNWIPVSQHERNREDKPVQRAMTSDMIPGLKRVAAEMMEGATDEEKKKFYEMCMTEKVKR